MDYDGSETRVRVPWNGVLESSEEGHCHDSPLLPILEYLSYAIISNTAYTSTKWKHIHMHIIIDKRSLDVQSRRSNATCRSKSIRQPPSFSRTLCTFTSPPATCRDQILGYVSVCLGRLRPGLIQHSLGWAKRHRGRTAIHTTS